MRPRSLALAALLCGAWWLAAMYVTRGHQTFPPDAVHTAVVARNLVRGLGNTIDWVPFHFGLRDGVRHVPEWHGVLQAPLLAGLFAVLGVDESLVRVPGLSFAAGTGLVTFAFARAVFGVGAAWLACLLTLSSAAFLLYGRTGTDDAGFAFFFTCTIFLCHLGVTRDARHLRWAGIAGALALLEKQTGLCLPLVYVVVLWLARKRGVPLGPAALRLLGPFAVALGVYLVRNHAAYGGLGFRLGPLNWLYKAHGNAALYRLYDPPPTLGSVLAALGPAGVAELVVAQVRALLRAALVPRPLFAPWPLESAVSLNLLALGVPSLALHARHARVFVVLCSAAVVASVVFICGLYSAEPRYFMMLLPLAAISLAGAIARGAQTEGGDALHGAVGWAARVAAILVVGYAVAFGAKMRVLVGPAQENRLACAAAAAWMRDHVPPDAVVLALAPWWTSWTAERLAVVAPSGRAADVRRVARHYDATWALLEPWPPERRAKVERALRGAALELDAARVLERDGCAVYRLRWRADRR